MPVHYHIPILNVELFHAPSMAMGDILLPRENTLLALLLDNEQGLEDETVKLFVLAGIGPTTIILPLFMGEEEDAAWGTFVGTGWTRFLRFIES